MHYLQHTNPLFGSTKIETIENLGGEKMRW